MIHRKSERNYAMKAQFLILAGLVFVVSSATRAQGIYAVSFSAAAFGYDQARLALAPPGRLLFTWSQESNLNQMSVRSLADEVRNETKRQLENVGFSLVAGNDGQSPDVISQLSCVTPKRDAPGTLIIELYDAKTKALLWRGLAEDALNDSNSQNDRQIVDRTIAWMFKHFPYHVNEWRSAERFADLR
jgi:hypothetical protein